MKKLITLSIVLVCAAIVLGTCSNSLSSGGPEFVGTWTSSGGGQTETLTFTANSLSVSDSGMISGNGTFSFQAVDEGSKHIKMSLSSGTGIYSLVPIGTVFYMTYSVTGNTLSASMSGSGYPSSAATPYARQ
jgi:hypothetical protein